MKLSISELPPAKKRKAIKIYLDTFVRQEKTPCQPCGGACCWNCSAMGGYFRTEKEIREKQQQHGWDEKKGFLTKTGCRIPYKERSGVCVSYVCGNFSLGSINKALDLNDLLVDPSYYRG